MILSDVTWDVVCTTISYGHIVRVFVYGPFVIVPVNNNVITAVYYRGRIKIVIYFYCLEKKQKYWTSSCSNKILHDVFNLENRVHNIVTHNFYFYFLLSRFFFFTIDPCILLKRLSSIILSDETYHFSRKKKYKRLLQYYGRFLVAYVFFFFLRVLIMFQIL